MISRADERDGGFNCPFCGASVVGTICQCGVEFKEESVLQAQQRRSKPEKTNQWKCPRCGELNIKGASNCKHCSVGFRYEPETPKIDYRAIQIQDLAGKVSDLEVNITALDDAQKPQQKAEQRELKCPSCGEPIKTYGASNCKHCSVGFKWEKPQTPKKDPWQAEYEQEKARAQGLTEQVSALEGKVKQYEAQQAAIGKLQKIRKTNLTVGGKVYSLPIDIAAAVQTHLTSLESELQKYKDGAAVNQQPNATKPSCTYDAKAICDLVDKEGKGVAEGLIAALKQDPCDTTQLRVLLSIIAGHDEEMPWKAIDIASAAIDTTSCNGVLATYACVLSEHIKNSLSSQVPKCVAELDNILNAYNKLHSLRLSKYIKDIKDMPKRIAEEYLKLGKPLPAVPLLEAILNENPEDLISEKTLAGVYEQIGETEKAAKLLLTRGESYKKAGEFECAVEYLSRAAALRPQDSSIWYDLGEIYRGLGNKVEANKAYDRVLAINPRHGKALFAKHLTTPSPEEAVSLLKRRIEVNPLSVPHYSYACALEGIGRYEEALREYKQMGDAGIRNLVLLRRKMNAMQDAAKATPCVHPVILVETKRPELAIA